MLIQGNTKHIPLKDESVQLCCFSPPYWGLRKYSIKPLVWGGEEKCCEHEWGDEVPSQGQFCQFCGAWRGDLGLEPTPELYLDHMMQVMAECWRVLRDDGVCFVNIGDSYFGGGRAGNNPEYFGKHKMFGKTGWDISVFGKPMKTPPGMKPKSLCLIPQKFAIRCQEAGWIIRSEIIWAKPNPIPESVNDRPTRSHEQVWMMVKNGRYYWDQDAVRCPVADSTISRGPVDFGGAKGRNYQPNKNDPNYRGGNEQWGRTFNYIDSCKKGRNIRDVWSIATEPTPEAHFATWPSKLVERMIRAATKLGDIVFDPFCGTGKTVIEAERLNRIGIGMDLSWEYLHDIAVPRNAMPLQKELAVLL